MVNHNSVVETESNRCKIKWVVCIALLLLDLEIRSFTNFAHNKYIKCMENYSDFELILLPGRFQSSCNQFE